MDMKFAADRFKRHKEASAILRREAAKHLKNNPTFIYKLIASKVDCSHITVKNYVHGMCGDGFLTEQLAYEFQQYNIKNK